MKFRVVHEWTETGFKHQLVEGEHGLSYRYQMHGRGDDDWSTSEVDYDVLEEMERLALRVARQEAE